MRGNGLLHVWETLGLVFPEAGPRGCRRVHGATHGVAPPRGLGCAWPRARRVVCRPTRTSMTRMRSWPPIDRDDLRHAAGSAGFDTVFPLLVRRLIAETAVGLESVDMPGGSGTAAGGFDGVVKTKAASAFVPQGVSVWELSVGGGQSKAEHDYSIRLDGPDGLPTTDVTYVEAILAPWTKARSWVKDRTKDGRWRSVLGYNLDRIHAWLDQAPATTVWLAGQLGKAMPGVRCLEVWWKEAWLESTRVPLDHSIVLAGRESAGSELISAISGGERVICLGGNLRPDEACAFVAAALERVLALDGVVGARALYVSDSTSLERLLAQPQALILLLSDADLSKGLAIPKQHQILVLATPGTSGDLNVPRVDAQVVSAQLEAAGLRREEAARLGVLGRRSFLGMRRALALHPALHTPSWAHRPDPVMRRMLLIGSWCEATEAERTVVATCTGLPYDQVQARAEELSSAHDVPFISRVDDVWHVVAFEDAWTLLAPSITGDDLEAFRAVMSEVLGEGDPALEMPAQDAWKAGLAGVKRKFSRDIRRALAGTLALMAAVETPIVGAGGRTTAQFAVLAVREILSSAQSDDTYRGWLSLIDVLAELAEAAPQEFLNAMRDGLAGDSPAHAAMFRDNQLEQHGFGSSSPHTYFLWALERLAWSPDYIDEATDILAGLAEIDPGGRLTNRPLASLAGILSAWCPNTSATADDRIRCIRNVCDRYPLVAPKLLASLIPDGHGFQIDGPGPTYRDWKRRAPVTNGDLASVLTAVVDKMVEQLGEDPDRLAAAVEKIDDVSSAHRASICQRLIELAGSLDIEARASLYDALRDKLAHHREYSDSAWALPEDELQPMQTACDALVPNDPVLKHAWLFRSDWLTLGDLKRRDDHAAYEAEVKDRRAQAIGEVMAAGGLDAALALARKTEYPGVVGFALADHSPNFDETMLARLTADPEPERTLAAGYLQNRLRAEGPSLRDSLLGGTGDFLAQARVLRLTNDPIASWEKLKSLHPAVSEHYWREFVYLGLGADFAGVLEAAWAMLDVQRAAATLDMMALYIPRLPPDQEAAEVVAAAMEMLLQAGGKDPELSRLDRYHFEQLFALLAMHRESLGTNRVVALEWQMYPITGLRAQAPSLHTVLVQDSAFFSELIELCFKPDTPELPDEQEGDPPMLERNNAARAYEVLSSCPLCPGTTEDGRVDGSELAQWVEGARTALAAVDRLAVGDLHIGQLLANAPEASDGSPLNESVRDLLETLRNDEVERGIGIGIYNARGMTSRGVYDGGAQEWALAKKYATSAEAAKAWPRTRRILQDLAAEYEADARRLDAEAERRRQGMGW